MTRPTRLRQDISDHVAGDSARLEATIRDQDGNAYDLTNHDAVWKLTDGRTSSDAIAEKSINGGGVRIVDAAAGRIDVTIDPADTETLDGRYWHELEVTDPTDNDVTVLAGQFRVYPSTT